MRYHEMFIVAAFPIMSYFSSESVFLMPVFSPKKMNRHISIRYLSMNKYFITQISSLVVLEAWPWPRGSSSTPHEGLAMPWSWMTLTWSWPWPWPWHLRPWLWPWHLRPWPWPWEKSLGLGLVKLSPCADITESQNGRNWNWKKCLLLHSQRSIVKHQAINIKRVTPPPS